MDKELLITLAEYHDYANRMVLDAAERLSDDELQQVPSKGQNSVLATLTHLLATEAYFLAWCEGQPFRFRREQYPDVATLRKFVECISTERGEFLAKADASDLLREVEIDMSGHTLRFPVWQMLVQAYVHATHHRGELAILFGAMGQPLPTLDIIVYFYEQHGKPWPFKAG